MYNEELKMEHINEKISKSYTEENSKANVLRNFLEHVFEKVSAKEEELGKDVCNFTKAEILEYYKTSNIISFYSASTINSIFSVYVRWCLQKNLVTDCQNHFEEMDNETLMNVVNKFVFNKRIVTREKMIELCEELINPRDRFVLLSIFEGIKGDNFKEIVNLRPEDIDEAGAHLCTGRVVQISDLLRKYIYQAVNESVYYSVSDKMQKTMPLLDKGFVFKNYPNTKNETDEFQKGRIVYHSILRSLKYLGLFKFVTANSIYDSGKIHMIKTRAKELNMTAEEYLFSKYKHEVEERYNCIIQRKQFYLKYKDHLD